MAIKHPEEPHAAPGLAEDLAALTRVLLGVPAPAAPPAPAVKDTAPRDAALPSVHRPAVTPRRATHLLQELAFLDD